MHRLVLERSHKGLLYFNLVGWRRSWEGEEKLIRGWWQEKKGTLEGGKKGCSSRIEEQRSSATVRVLFSPQAKHCLSRAHTDATSLVQTLCCALLSSVSHSATSPPLFAYRQYCDEMSGIALPLLFWPLSFLFLFCPCLCTSPCAWRHSVTAGFVMLKCPISVTDKNLILDEIRVYWVV